MKVAVSGRLYSVVILVALLVPIACNSSDKPSSPGASPSRGSTKTGGPATFPERLTLTPVARGLKSPVTISNAGDGSGRLFVLEQRGRIRIVKNGTLLPSPFLDISLQVRSGGEQGLLGIAFPPGFSSGKAFYLNYTNKKGIGNTVVASVKVGADPDRADPSSLKQILEIVQPYANHNGGQLAFGPDGHLYIGMGDGGSAGDPKGNGQRKDTLLGKMLRLDVTSGSSPYGIPKGNPFGDEIWAYGLRNPWRFSFDRANGDLYIADVGQNEVEEIHYQPAGKGAGANYGWNIMEGSRCFRAEECSKKGLELPVAEYYHGKGDCSITGGYVYRGSIEELKGIYLYGDYCSGRIWGLKRVGNQWQSKMLLKTDHAISAFGEDEKGELYLADHNGGTIYRIGVK